MIIVNISSFYGSAAAGLACVSCGRRGALECLLFGGEVIVAHHSEAEDQPSELGEVHLVVLI